ncbi:ribokinase [Microvirga lotononidis]|uniref:Ribokinase n=1 Tax=Microvirga lotononidis TaxID=864069 RepID=I4YL57_9HYPH|nr:ribokinase [Microvirga lotononidis]EIM24699.1 sugar kinase, ribokinase [Microvirga lotononidis]WQO26709.1 ribokinase [Microvirga lotononidis]
MIVIFGSINMDLVARVQRIARPGETVLSRRADSFFGGKGANQAVAAARVSQGGPLRVAMVGAVGNDPFGEACRKNLDENGVDVSTIRVTDEPTGCAFITVDETGENAITVASGANMALRSDDLPESLLSKASVLVLQMEVPIADSLEVAARARRAGVKLVWNFAPVPAVKERSAIAELLAVTDVLVVNEHEALAIADVIGERADDDFLCAGADISRLFGPTCIVTAGSRGAYAITPDGAQIHATARPIRPVDTTGAGDTFVGVLANGLAEGLEVGPAMERACAAASLSCLTAGAQAGMPQRRALEHHLAQA